MTLILEVEVARVEGRLLVATTNVEPDGLIIDCWMAEPITPLATCD